MTTQSYFLKSMQTLKELKKVPTSKATLPLLFTVALSACSTTTVQQDEQPIAANKSSELQSEADTSCRNHARNIAKHAESVASTVQYLAAAKAMNSCISTALQNRAYQGFENNNPQQIKPQQETIMKMMAVATLNFIKGGDVITATREVERFKRVYPNQDLYFKDYTSFLDTATALLSVESLGASQISSLNISRVLRDEIERKHYWLNH
jgi:hypothetical protein